MAYSEALAQRVRKALARRKDLREIRMFGGLCFTVRGHMACGVLGDDLVVRVDPEAWEEASREPHVRPMDFTGKPLQGFLYVAKEGTRTPAGLKAWIVRAVRFAESLPPKTKRKG
ncbi:MAG TPA: TfoX/Sxy family protein [Planctomycetota bacterium]|nr:TfoX/Sxy family protein [Planctomycetota bacterium]